MESVFGVGAEVGVVFFHVMYSFLCVTPTARAKAHKRPWLQGPVFNATTRERSEWSGQELENGPARPYCAAVSPKGERKGRGGHDSARAALSRIAPQGEPGFHNFMLSECYDLMISC